MRIEIVVTQLLEEAGEFRRQTAEICDREISDGLKGHESAMR
ncbi:hypothetical protein [Sorangium atrum]|uniref:Uncharacterized protein n=1 Tax=Sorangium atrum TaxID=2995308 RepID=A0ABT5C4U8_9BACT|nr:hypothetical protein [Sorangium aterium]MDC0681440.1 hypothetical protein [Sorangium aterium]